MKLRDGRALGRSGLLVSPLCLGTMTFGTKGWGSEDAVSQSIFNEYIDAGGNFLDTAEAYSGGRSEELLGRFINERVLREGVVLSTKYGWNGQDGNPLSGGTGRKNIVRALESSLKRLGTDYLDLYWMHVWDGITPVEEILGALGDLVRAGKIRYFGLSNVPVWVTTRAATLAQMQGVPGPIALQLEYSLVERSIEREFVPAAREMGLGITPWSPLGAGFLSGKYTRDNFENAGRLSGPNPFGDSKFSPRNWEILDAAREVADEIEQPLAGVALAWALSRPGVSSVLLGARTSEQLRENLASLEVELSPRHLARLEQASALPAPPVASFEEIQRWIFAGANVSGWR